MLGCGRRCDDYHCLRIAAASRGRHEAGQLMRAAVCEQVCGKCVQGRAAAMRVACKQ